MSGYDPPPKLLAAAVTLEHMNAVGIERELARVSRWQLLRRRQFYRALEEVRAREQSLLRRLDMTAALAER